jgi:hypothetical protein
MAYLPLSTANLPDPVIDPAQGSSPEDYFDVDTYTGTGATHKRTLSFQPDWLWSKARNQAYNQILIDSVRGTDKGLFSDVTNAEGTNSAYLSSFDSDGYTLSTIANNNGNNVTFATWAWKANGSGVSNTDGSITSTVSANTESGFSIGTFVGNQTAGATVGHGLSQAPEMIIIKDRPTVNDWPVYHTSISPSQTIKLNSTNAAFTESTVWNNTAPTASVFTLGSSNLANNNTKSHVFYAFHSVEGFSKCSSYVGNGSTDGTFVYTGFKPAFVMVRRTNNSDDWELFDTARTSYNGLGIFLRNTSAAEARDDNYPNPDFLSNGFKWRSLGGSVNDTGHTYIYMAFAENPFKFSTAS